MRASTGIYMPVNISALNIPPWSTNVSKILLNHLDAMEGKNDASLLSYIQRFICPYLPGISVNQILATYKTLISDENQKHPASLRELYEEHSLQGRLHRSPEAFDPRGKHCYQRRSLRSLWRQRSLGRYVGRHLTKTKEMLDDMHKRKIDMADEIFVINVGGYFGESTLSEIEYANATGKAVRYLGRQ